MGMNSEKEMAMGKEIDGDMDTCMVMGMDVGLVMQLVTKMAMGAAIAAVLAPVKSKKQRSY